jgi:hypothetical protein
MGWCGSEVSIKISFNVIMRCMRTYSSRLSISSFARSLPNVACGCWLLSSETIFQYIIIIIIIISFVFLATSFIFIFSCLQMTLRESKDVAKATSRVSSNDIENCSLHHNCRFPAFKFKEIWCEVKSAEGVDFQQLAVNKRSFITCFN